VLQLLPVAGPVRVDRAYGPAPIEKAIEEGGLVVASVLSGNRNFEGRVHAKVRANYLASPPLVVAYALAGDVNIDITKDALGVDGDGHKVFFVSGGAFGAVYSKARDGIGVAERLTMDATTTFLPQSLSADGLSLLI